MTDAEYQNHVDALISLKLDKPKRLKREAARCWFEITSGQCLFDREEREVQELRGVSKAELVELYSAWLAAASPDDPKRARQRRKLAIHVHAAAAEPTAPGPDAAATATAATGDQIAPAAAGDVDDCDASGRSGMSGATDDEDGSGVDAGGSTTDDASMRGSDEDEEVEEDDADDASDAIRPPAAARCCGGAATTAPSPRRCPANAGAPTHFTEPPASALRGREITDVAAFKQRLSLYPALV